jgi:glycosyltransferase involved in cell wall biosynthesis
MMQTTDNTSQAKAATRPEPRVSVIIPAYNAAWCVRRAIDSVLAQRYRDFELIVVDDGSQDDTASILAGYGDAIRVLKKSNGGLSSARNAGILAAVGAYVAFLDADDWWHPEKLLRQTDLMEQRPELVFCSIRTSVQTPEGNPLPDWRCAGDNQSTLAAIFKANAHVAGSGSAVMARRTAFAQVGGFDESLRSLEDIDMWMRLAAIGEYDCIDEPLATIVKHADSMSGNLDMMRSSAISVMRKNRHLLTPALRKGYWRAAYAGMLADYAKWEYRQGRSWQAVAHLMQAMLLAPLQQGRLLGSLLFAVLTRQTLSKK